LESIEFDKRKSNIIVTGVPEIQPLKCGDNSADSDVDKIKLVMNRIGINTVEIGAINRLGIARQPEQTH